MMLLFTKHVSGWESLTVEYRSDHLADDPTSLAAQPMSLQIVGRPFEDEETIEVTAVVDGILNPA